MSAPATRLADDLDVIGHLDWTPTCETTLCAKQPTPRPAQWLVIAHTTCCEHRVDFLTCSPCKEKFLQLCRRDNSRPWGICSVCYRSVFPTKHGPSIVVDAITALGGGS
ncbi:hypothetical protein [uncultured Aeromicrobium sp.]|uniref:hypothetical protein n=1 Tax=uncultured Aeromicrobium sp. TaxID=337820 RepID=UPI0025D44FA1|nr:hypothetical protein [uncultured Aeromicrobium sp.]